MGLFGALLAFVIAFNLLQGALDLIHHWTFKSCQIRLVIFDAHIQVFTPRIELLERRQYALALAFLQQLILAFVAFAFFFILPLRLDFSKLFEVFSLHSLWFLHHLLSLLRYLDQVFFSLGHETGRHDFFSLFADNVLLLLVDDTLFIYCWGIDITLLTIDLPESGIDSRDDGKLRTSYWACHCRIFDNFFDRFGSLGLLDGVFLIWWSWCSLRRASHDPHDLRLAVAHAFLKFTEVNRRFCYFWLKLWNRRSGALINVSLMVRQSVPGVDYLWAFLWTDDPRRLGIEILMRIQSSFLRRWLYYGWSTQYLITEVFPRLVRRQMMPSPWRPLRLNRLTE